MTTKQIYTQGGAELTLSGIGGAEKLTIMAHDRILGYASVRLTQAQVAELLPALQYFAENGELPQQPNQWERT